MIALNPAWGGQDVIQDSAPADGMAITFLPSIINDALGAIPQLESEASTRSFMQDQFRAASENMRESGLLYNSGV